MSIAYIALGSNLGDKEANLRQALKMLLVKGLQIRSVSSFFKTGVNVPESRRSRCPNSFIEIVFSSHMTIIAIYCV